MAILSFRGSDDGLWAKIYSVMSDTSQTITTVVTVSTVHPGPGGGAIFTAQDTSGEWLKAKAGYDCMPLAPVKGQVWELTGSSNTTVSMDPNFMSSRAVRYSRRGNCSTATSDITRPSEGWDLVMRRSLNFTTGLGMS